MLAVLAVLACAQATRVDYEPFAGLQVSVDGIGLLRGSSFEYIDPKSRKTLYSSRWAPKQVEHLPDGTIRVRYSGDNGNAIGTHDFKQTLTGLSVRYEFRWRGDRPVRVDNCLALVWAPAVNHGEILVDGR